MLRRLRLTIATLALLGGLPSRGQAVTIDVIVPTHATVRTLASGNMIQDFFGWVVVTSGTLTAAELNAAVVQLTLSDPGIAVSSSGLSISNAIAPLGPGDVAGTSRISGLTDNSVFSSQLAPGEALVLPALDWFGTIDWPGSNLSQTETLTTTVEIAGLSATYQTTIDFVGPGPVLFFSGAQRLSLVPEPSSGLLTGLGLLGLVAWRRRVAA